MQMNKVKKGLLKILKMIIVLSILLLTGCDTNSPAPEIINNQEDTPNKDVLLVEEPLLEEEDFDWVIEVDDTSEIIPYVEGNRMIGRLRMRLVNRSGYASGDYVGESMLRILMYKEDACEFQGQHLPFLVAIDYTSETATCNIEPTSDDFEPVPLIPSSDEVSLAPLAPLIIEGYSGVGENNYVASEFASMITDPTDIEDEETELFRFVLTTKEGVANIIVQHPILGPFTFTGKMIGYGKESKVADILLEPFPISDDDETWARFSK
ncbi:hypothetical protein [Tissierella sp.]|uniref:hypothetical protein n=1 Tax=Tissierella sp. TaxID=41274 RepID=UPI0028595D09|nr:hypothetical protein [Tissierella sp.]MDR7856867.1 hypothetical protein [Tissierella sp.]